MSPTQIHALAALMGHSNMGLEKESLKAQFPDLLGQVRRGPRFEDRSLEDCVYALSQSWIESDEIEQAFLEEARMWVGVLSPMPPVEIFKTWPWLSDFFTLEILEPAHRLTLEAMEAATCDR